MDEASIVQGTAEWRAIRLGKVTASRVADMTARTKSGWGASRANYAAQLIVERLTGIPAETYTSAAMQHGIDTEAEALSCYVFMHDATVTPVGFVPHPTIPNCGASPDGLCAPDGLVEIKCPQSPAHIDTLLTQKVPERYFKQIQFQLAVTGRAWCDYISYDPRLPQNMRLFVKRVERNANVIAELEKQVVAFLAEIDDTLARLGAIYEIPGIEPQPTVKEQLVASAKQIGIGEYLTV